ncbi:PH domain-containing protein [Frondihabitans sp. PAMC 28766]|uniref:PH domain-containing protein n=1 Tax=Frondihabitans sp. PAMC 28766 TaxID=1795630 RepID=UPI0009E6F9E5|nr:PH domain-containing protein [Frondihabitans sp. PAMC 28766]
MRPSKPLEPQPPGRAPGDQTPSRPATPSGARAAEQLTDGQWHRLHPATPLLRGGFALVVILGFVLNNFRERLLELVIPDPGGRHGGGTGGGGNGGNDGDPVDYVIANRLEWVAVLAVLALLVILVGIFYLSWRMNSFRVTDETVEVRSGVVFRTNRRARLDRIQGINVQRPLFARIFGAAKLEINQAGHDANVPLAYLRSASADDVRRAILSRASGVREAEQQSGDPARGAGLIEQRLHEFMASPLGEDTEWEAGAAAARNPSAASAGDRRGDSPSVVRMRLGRLIGSAVLSGFTLFLALIIAAVVVSIATTGQFFLLVIFLPTIIGSFSYYSRRVVKSLRYSIASTRDGIRIGWGLLSTSNETLPPGRIHSIRLSQPLAWRPFGWWEVKINRASHSSTKGADNMANTTILPVGSAADVTKVLQLILPELVGLTAADVAVQDALDRGDATPADVIDSQPRRAVEEGRKALSLIEAGMTSKGRDGGFTTSPRRGQWLRWFSWRRNGFRTAPGAVLLRKGAIWRQLIVVPLPRVQSAGLRQGPLLRRLRLAEIELHTVQGPITAEIGALDAQDAMAFFQTAAHDAVVAARADRTHRWLDTASGAAAGSTPAGSTSAVDATWPAPSVAPQWPAPPASERRVDP